jgi:microcystin-dependent protein
MSTPFLSELRIMSFIFAPKGWALCNGQTLPINQNQALFSLLGTTYGGNGQTTFQLPDLRGRVPIHMGGGFTLGERAGEESHTIINSEMAAHNHGMKAKDSPGGQNAPLANDSLARGQAVVGQTLVPVNIYGTGNVTTTFNPATISNVGGNQPHLNQQPFTVLSVCIALQGVFPSQN